MTRRMKASLLGGIFVTTMLNTAPASSQVLGPCPMFMPPPCLVFDFKKLADMATKRAQEVAKFKELTSELQGWKASTDAIGKTINDVKGLANTDVMSGFGKFGDFDMGSMIPAVPNITSVKQNVSTAVFAGAQANNDAVMIASRHRQSLQRASNVDAIALRYTINKQVENTGEAMGRLTKAMDESQNLRTDWSVNSAVRTEIVRANALQDYLWQAYLSMRSTNGIQMTDVASPKAAFKASSTTGTSPGSNKTADWLKVEKLQALSLEASRLKESLGIAKSGQEVNTLLQSIVTEQQSALERQTNAYNQLSSAAGRWSNETGKGYNGQQYIMNQINASLSGYDSTWAYRRTLDPTDRQLLPFYAASGLDYGQIMQGEADPRQFLGTWADPGKAKQMADLARSLRSNSLKKYIDGDNGTDSEMDRLLAAYNDTRLEVAWQKKSYDEAMVSINGGVINGARVDGIRDEIAKVQAGASVNLDDDTVWARLIAIANEANDVGKELQGSTDGALLAAAQVPINELQVIVNGKVEGLQLPVVDPNTTIADDEVDRIQQQTYQNPDIRPEAVINPDNTETNTGIKP